MNTNNVLSSIVWQCLCEVHQANWSEDGISQSRVTCKTHWRVLHVMYPRSGVSGYSGWGKRQQQSLRGCASVGHVTGRFPSTCKSCSDSFGAEEICRVMTNRGIPSWNRERGSLSALMAAVVGGRHGVVGRMGSCRDPAGSSPDERGGGEMVENFCLGFHAMFGCEFR